MGTPRAWNAQVTGEVATGQINRPDHLLPATPASPTGCPGPAACRANPASRRTMIVAAYVAAAVAANLLIAAFGPGAAPIVAFFLIGMDLSLRDYLHERWAGRGLVVKMGALIAAAGLISYALNPASGIIAIASVAAFCAAAVVDGIVYQAMAGRRFLARANASNVGGALVDSILFPTIAFGAFLPMIVALQFAMKVGGGLLWSLILQRVLKRAS
jgi:queuosine precursor transporter